MTNTNNFDDVDVAVENQKPQEKPGAQKHNFIRTNIFNSKMQKDSDTEDTKLALNFLWEIKYSEYAPRRFAGGQREQQEKAAQTH